MKNKKAKIVMITMFKNESKNILRMLNSCLPHVDYYVMQNNGSTDGTDEIAKKFLLDNNLSGEIYLCEEGWKGFGWNRDHLIQYCQQKSDHGCDWILKMDCDEILEVDDDFDWSILDDTSIQSFHIPAVQGTAIYHRAWMYNAKMPWRFNHDPCHETVYCDLPEIGKNFQRYDLPPSFRQTGFNSGESWSDPFKFIKHSLTLEQQMISDGTMLSNLYHFWYIGKSYFDARECSEFPLGDSQKKEYARRAIYYFEEFVNYLHKDKTNVPIDETSYLSLLYCGECYEMLNNYSAAITSYNFSERFAPGRNDHIWALARLYEKMGDYENMLKQTTRMMDPERTNAFPRYLNFIDTAMYWDSPTGKVQEIHNRAIQKYENSKPKELPLFSIKKSLDRKIFVVDNFYDDPDRIRNYALSSVEFESDIRWYKGLRSKDTYRPDSIKRAFENIIGERINLWDDGYNGCFQITTSNDPQVYHYDQQRWAGMIYLTPDAPLESGTRSHKSKITGLRHSTQEGIDNSFSYGFYDSTKFDIVDNIGNIYNRLLIMDARAIHSAGPYFGRDEQNGRLTHLFFFE